MKTILIDVVFKMELLEITEDELNDSEFRCMAEHLACKIETLEIDSSNITDETFSRLIKQIEKRSNQVKRC